MGILFVLIPLAVVLIAGAIAAFFWATNNKQFDDLDSPAYIVLLDDDPSEAAESKALTNKKSTKQNDDIE